ncbi:MAG: hypothetical protein C4287_20615, partial [Leptolyngbya sp. ERB_1_2]
PADYRAAYIHQISPDQTLFGWLYNDGADDFNRSHVPYFVCYYLPEALSSDRLKSIFTYLLIGPIEQLDRDFLPDMIPSIEIPDEHYQSARPGIRIFAPVQEQGFLSVQQGELFRMFVSEDSTGQDLQVVTSVRAEESAQENNALEEAEAIAPGAVPSAIPGTEDAAKLIDELITRSEVEKYQQMLLASEGVQPIPVRLWKSSGIASGFRKALIGIAVFSGLMISGVYLLRLLPSASQRLPSTQHPASAVSPTLQKTFLDTAPIWAVVLTPDGQTVIGGGANQTIKLWNIETGNVLTTLSGHRDIVRSLVLTPDGKTLISGSGDRTIKIWDLQTSQVIQTIEQGTPIWGLALSPDGKTLFSGSDDGALIMWQFPSGERLQTIPAHQQQICSIAVSPDGKTVATASHDQTIKLWDTQTGALIRTLTGHTDVVGALAFSPDGNTIASTSWDKTVKLWNWQTGQVIRTLSGHEDRVIAVGFSSDGQTLISGGVDRRINVWAVQDGTLLRSLQDHTDWVLSLFVAPQFDRFVSGSKDQTVRVWKIR